MKKQKIKLKGGYIPTSLSGEDLENHMREKKRGCGVHRSAKDYRRHEKHKQKLY